MSVRAVSETGELGEKEGVQNLTIDLKKMRSPFPSHDPDHGVHFALFCCFVYLSEDRLPPCVGSPGLPPLQLLKCCDYWLNPPHQARLLLFFESGSCVASWRPVLNSSSLFSCLYFPNSGGLQACAAPSLLVLFCFVLRRRWGIGDSAWLVVVMHAFNTSPREEKAGGSL